MCVGPAMLLVFDVAIFFIQGAMWCIVLTHESSLTDVSPVDQDDDNILSYIHRSLGSPSHSRPTLSGL